MKFEYDGKSNDRECVAVIRDIDGLLNIAIKTDEGCTFMYGSDCTPNHGDQDDWMNELNNAIHKFYPNDKITITF